MMETLPTACMQQYYQPMQQPIRPSCKGVFNPHSIAMKSHSPPHEELMADPGDYDGQAYIESLDLNCISSRMYPYPGTDGFDVGVFNGYGEFQQTNIATQLDCSTITAVDKPLMINSNVDDDWESKHPKTWTHNQLAKWLVHICKEKKLDYENLRVNNVTGETLHGLSEMDFRSRFPCYSDTIYEAYQDVLYQWQPMGDSSSPVFYQSPMNHSYYDNLGGQNLTNGDHLNANLLSNQYNGGNNPQINNQSYHYLQTYDNVSFVHLGNHGGNIKSEVDSEGESNQSFATNNLYPHNTVIAQTDENPELQRRRRGRPQLKDKKKNKNGQRSSRLWEFIRDLLLDTKTCPSLLKWENAEEGIFRFVQSDKVARLWGERKCNPKMTYEKLSRAMRYYYKSQVFQPVIGRRLVYKFGPNATGWRPKKGTTNYKLPMVTQLDG